MTIEVLLVIYGLACFSLGVVVGYALFGGKPRA